MFLAVVRMIWRCLYISAQFDHALFAELASKQLTRSRSVILASTVIEWETYLLPKECGIFQVGEVAVVGGDVSNCMV
jgi:hypothetical protein